MRQDSLHQRRIGSNRARRHGIVFECAAAGMIALLAAMCGTANAGPILQTFVSVAGGRTDQSTQGPLPEVQSFFGNAAHLLLATTSLPATGVAGTIRSQTSTVGPLTDTASVISPVFTTTFAQTNTFTGSTAVNARYGKVGATAHGVYSGQSDTFTEAGAEGFGMFVEPLTVTDPSISNGAAGFQKLRFKLDGQMIVQGPGVGTLLGARGTAQVILAIQQNNGPISGLVQARIDGLTDPAFFRPFDGPGRAGFTIIPTAIGGSGEFETEFPIIFGQSFDYRLGLLATVLPILGGDVTIDVSFGASALLTGIVIFDANRNSLHDFSISSGSGTRYDANGVHFDESPVPVPASLALLSFGMAGLLGYGLRRRKATA